MRAHREFGGRTPLTLSAGVSKSTVRAIGTALLAFWMVALVALFWRAAWRYPLFCTGFLALIASAFVLGFWGPIDLVLIVGIAGLLWSALGPRSYDRWVGRRLRMEWARFTLYGRQWNRMCLACGVAVRQGERVVFPTLKHIRVVAGLHYLTVRMRMGQTPEVFEQASTAIAHALGAMSVRVRSLKPGWVLLEVQFIEPLAGEVLPPPIPEVAGPLDLDRVVIGVDEYGKPFVLRLLEAIHVLVAGATGAGKAMFVWAILYWLAPWIRTGQVQVYGIDPKGGMELGCAPAVFTEVVYGANEEAVELLEKIAALTEQRAAEIRGANGKSRRKWTQDSNLHAVILVIDELAALLAYLQDKKLRDRATRALGVICTQGRAPGVFVIAEVQDPRKEVVPYRHLFPTRIALRLEEASETDMILGPAVRERGANAHEIPKSLPGVAFVKVDGQREPERIRSYHVTDAHLDYLNAYIEAGRSPAPRTLGIAGS